MPAAANPKPVSVPMTGTSSMPGVGSRPKKNPTMSGAAPYTPDRTPIHMHSAVTISGTLTGAASSASYVRWYFHFTSVPKMPLKTDENRTAVATVPSEMNSMYSTPPTLLTSDPNPKPN